MFLFMLLTTLTWCYGKPRIQEGSIGSSGVEKRSRYDYWSELPHLPVPFCKPSEPIRYPTCHEEVVNIVKEAIARNTTVRAFGKRLSGTDIICTDGIPIDMRLIAKVRINPDMTVTAGAGASVWSIAEYLAERGRGIHGIPNYGNITVGGAIGTGAHGASLRLPSTISETVLELLVVDGRGRLRRIKKKSDLKAWRVHLGLLGIILEVTLPTVELYKIRANNVFLPDEILTDGTLLEMLENTDLLCVYWFPAYQNVIASQRSVVNVSTLGNAWTNDHVPRPSPGAAYASKLFPRVAHIRNSTETMNLFQFFMALSLIIQVPSAPPIYTEDSYSVKNPAAGLYYKMLAPVCQGNGKIRCPWLHGKDSHTSLLQAFAIPLEKFGEAVQTVRDILLKAPAVFPFTGIILRFARKSTSYMSFSRQGHVCIFEFYLPIRENYVSEPSLGLAAYQAITHSLVEKYGAQPHWGKSGARFHSTEFLAKRLDPPARDAFLRKMEEFDPNGVFSNSFSKRLRGKDTHIDSDPEVRHCALLDVCTCSLDSDCAQGQKCSRLRGYPLYPVCLYPGTGEPLPALNLSLFLKPVEIVIKFINSLARIWRAAHS